VIARYIVILLIIVLSVSAFLLPKLPAQIPIYKKYLKKTGVANHHLEKYPVPATTYKDAPEITATSALVIDFRNDISLFEKNPNLKHFPASTTKLMTALTTLENCSPQTVVTVDQIEKEGTQMGLDVGDRITVEHLLDGLLIASGNDAAYALANSCSDSYQHFMQSMNQKAKDLGMTNTHIVNPAGFDDNFQYSTAWDLTKLAKVAVANPLIAQIVATKSTVVTDFGGNKTYYLENVNKLLGIDGVEGIKTGQTEGSLENLITKTTRNGNSIIVVILGSRDRFGETEQLIDWVFNNYQWVNTTEPTSR